MQNKSEMINRIAELAEENAELKKYIERMDKPEIQVIDAEILTLKEENAKLNAIIDGYQPRLQRYKDVLQEIREMAKRGFAVCDDDCGNAIRYTQILNIINKAEEE